MSREELLNQMRPVFNDIFDVPEEEITESTTLKEIAGWDSLNHIILIATLETVFSIRVDMKESMNLRSVRLLLDYIEEKL